MYGHFIQFTIPKIGQALVAVVLYLNFLKLPFVACFADVYKRQGLIIAKAPGCRHQLGRYFGLQPAILPVLGPFCIKKHPSAGKTWPGGCKTMRSDFGRTSAANRAAGRRLSARAVLYSLYYLFRQYRIILSADTANEVRQLLSQKRR